MKTELIVTKICKERTSGLVICTVAIVLSIIAILIAMLAVSIYILVRNRSTSAGNILVTTKY